MLSGVPNFVYTVGYTNASWTLKADLVTDYACRLLDHLDQNGLQYAVAARGPVRRARSRSSTSAPATCCARSTSMPKQGDRAPWLLKQNYITDVRMIRRDDIDDGVLELRLIGYRAPAHGP